ncbi:hypothetical protein CH298_28070 [Rhodococcoides fascians]|uniref:MFS transporter n=1 Tax=Rhodococcoides fascians TaxID=1828 RepID=UPI000B9B7578|nr:MULTISPECIES: MFS transporter [Rhodococcus]OZD68989.1 hypothetical protein CH263_08905 [Rhodococcus sp. 06-1059B-a]OZE81078.1 hypothetical protein CH303_27810 [Rhodococcus fascians]OZF08332.1 hypothetical protein CH298_28070 [Rhodococcus fascians]OZF12332.1 hypothetical protein CH297_27810 [Rhodococcus fascians]OZF59088.1 hypothetical protein CH308_28085 [Rhodococcus fascians]
MSTNYDTEFDRRLIRKTFFRVLPVLCFLVFMGYLDRISVAYAGPSGMNADLALTATTFGLIGGIFTIGYVIFAIPGAHAMNRLGARRWMTIIAITWGSLQAVSALMPNFWMLLVVRVLVGVAEASLIPVAYAHTANWFPNRYRPLALGIVTACIGSAGIFGPMLATALMQSATSLPIAEWRFMMFMLGLVAVVAGLSWYRYAADTPEAASWLNNDEKVRLSEWLVSEHKELPESRGAAVRVLRDWRSWTAGLCYFCLVYVAITMAIWAPTIVDDFSTRFDTDFNPYAAAALVGTPALCTLVVQISMGAAVGRFGRPARFMVIGTVIGAAGCLLATAAGSPVTMMLSICIAASASTGVVPALLATVPRIFIGANTVMAFTIMDIVGASAGLVGPFLTGLFMDLTGNNDAAFYFMAGFSLLGGVFGVVLTRAATQHEKSDSSTLSKIAPPLRA